MNITCQARDGDALGVSECPTFIGESAHHRTNAGVDDPLPYDENNRMLFGDAKKIRDEVLAALKS